MFRLFTTLLIIYLLWLSINAFSTMLSSDSTNDIIKYLGVGVSDLLFAVILIITEVIRTLSEFFNKFRFTYDEKLDGVADSEGGA